MDNTQWIVIIHIKLQITKSYNETNAKYNKKKQNEINFNKLQFKFSNDNIIINTKDHDCDKYII